MKTPSVEGAAGRLLIPPALWLPTSNLGKALMIGSILIVVIVELLNSAIEAAVDRISLDN